MKETIMPAHRPKQLRPDDDTQDFTVQATPTRSRKRAAPEDGLSVSPDELGTQFLSGATEQGNFEGELTPELSLSEGAASDEALPNGDLDSDGTVWDQTIRSAPRSDIREIRDPALRDEGERGVDPDSPDDEDEEHVPRTVDIHQTRIVGASLFDQEGDEAGETRTPDVRTDDQAR
jgi:hypothetical protein